MRIKQCESCEELREKNKALSLIIESKRGLIAALLDYGLVKSNQPNEKYEI